MTGQLDYQCGVLAHVILRPDGRCLIRSAGNQFVEQVMTDIHIEKALNDISGMGDALHGYDVVGVNPAHPADHHVKTLIQGLGIEPGIHLRFSPVVTVTMDYVISRGGLHSPAAAIRPAAVDVVAQNLHPAAPLRIINQHTLQDVHRGVRGAVIHEDELQILHGLPEKAAGTSFDVLLSLVDKDYDTYRRIHLFLHDNILDMPWIPSRCVR